MEWRAQAQEKRIIKTLSKLVRIEIHIKTAFEKLSY